ncbi:MAG: TetR/AcrR family transcriptional regulator [Meiothermus sp.]|uniref:TetR/AcrR family transcriptional regulator n=1 Tax=Meiothermus sp. TaxID=1955249 RepID=UPI00298EDD33|nr:TetR/AcrR family transcriptional regulator [Meiothermus sp.]MDW8090711.1 TetR/AcrR family transcriptional regulator [Meiothermus sp.]MDW8480862.1 TetR/AcrR family transcriptional regulator [Meiothermus sp.]
MNAQVKPQRKRRDGQATRERLIQATVEILSREGLGAVSTARVARDAGIVQSGFYAHFASLEECVVVAAEHIGQRIRDSIREGLSLLREQGVGDFELVLSLYRRLLTEVEAQWQFVELLLRYFREPTPLGRTLFSIQQSIRDELTQHLVGILKPLDIPDGGRPEAAFLADLMVSMLLSSVQSLRWEPSLNKELVLYLLTVETLSMVARTYDWMTEKGYWPKTTEG